MIKLVAFDIDGTLRDRDGMPASTKTAIRRLKEEGVQLALCTGRSEYEVRDLQEELGIDWTVTCNGSHVGFRGETVQGTAFPDSLVREWLTIAEREGHTLLLYSATNIFLNREDAPLFRKAQGEIGFLEPTLLQPGDAPPESFQVIVFCDASDEAKYSSASAESVYIHRWRPWAVDFNPAGMNKAVGLRRLIEHLKLSPSETAAFGDGMNDLEMLELAGVAIAMGNGCEEAKAAADHVTKPLHEDGIAHAVDAWIVPALR
ncbi:Cof-type HAD-IIB family hydrolase [Paenibacillus sp. TRM 82003]|nr:Cof-type HAD-IIB family hydrolase [Paenibacillus sp. TRM 82003]